MELFCPATETVHPGTKEESDPANRTPRDEHLTQYILINNSGGCEIEGPQPKVITIDF